MYALILLALCFITIYAVAYLNYLTTTLNNTQKYITRFGSFLYYVPGFLKSKNIDNHYLNVYYFNILVYTLVEFNRGIFKKWVKIITDIKYTLNSLIKNSEQFSFINEDETDIIDDYDFIPESKLAKSTSHCHSCHCDASNEREPTYSCCISDDTSLYIPGNFNTFTDYAYESSSSIFNFFDKKTNYLVSSTYNGWEVVDDLGGKSRCLVPAWANGSIYKIWTCRSKLEL